jgi:hypothetical protein
MYRRHLDFGTAKGNDADMEIPWRFSLVALLAASLQAQSGPTAGIQHPSINGMVTDSIGRPLAGTEVRLVVKDTVVSVTRTDEDGRFAVAGNIQGRSLLQLRRLGFQLREVELFFPRDSTRPLLIQLEVAAQELGATQVLDSSGAHGWLREFLERRQSNSHGHYFTRDDILKRRPQFLSEMLRTVPGVSIGQLRTGGFRLRMRGCRYAPMIWIDGTRAPGSELDEVARADDVGALEVYPTPAGVPAQYLDRSNVGCGTILVWTRLD